MFWSQADGLFSLRGRPAWVYSTAEVPGACLMISLHDPADLQWPFSQLPLLHSGTTQSFKWSQPGVKKAISWMRCPRKQNISLLLNSQFTNAFPFFSKAVATHGNRCSVCSLNAGEPIVPWCITPGKKFTFQKMPVSKPLGMTYCLAGSWPGSLSIRTIRGIKQVRSEVTLWLIAGQEDQVTLSSRNRVGEIWRGQGAGQLARVNGGNLISTCPEKEYSGRNSLAFIRT